MMKKELYAAPATEVLELRLEGTILAESLRGSASVEDRDSWIED